MNDLSIYGIGNIFKVLYIVFMVCFVSYLIITSTYTLSSKEITMQKHEILQCPRCNNELECKVGSISICHCSEVNLTEQQKSYITENWDSCLCHACLLSVSQLFDSKKSTRVKAPGA